MASGKPVVAVSFGSPYLLRDVPELSTYLCGYGPQALVQAAAARALYGHLTPFAAGGPLFLDAPENNPAALALVAEHPMREAFGCARMYLGPVPTIAHERVFGVTTFELG